MQRKIKKQFYVNSDENEMIKRKAEESCMDEATLLRTLIDEYRPTLPPAKFMKLMNNLKEKLSELPKENDNNKLLLEVNSMLNDIEELEAIYWQ